MDHSFRNYLSKRSTEELEGYLKYFLDQGNYRDVVLEILEILKQRDALTDLADNQNETEEPPYC